MPGSDKTELMPEAQRLFVEEGVSMAQIADIVRVNPKTIQRWCTDSDWRRLRLEHVRSYRAPRARLADILSNKIDEFEKCHIADITAKDIDILSKLTSSLQRLENKADLLLCVSEAMTEFLPFFKNGSPELYEKVDKSGILDDFIAYVTKKSGHR